jgi:hypothetical protein
MHISKGIAVAKFWLEPVRLAKSGGMGRAELSELERTVSNNRTSLLEAWYEFFGD